MGLKNTLIKKLWDLLLGLVNKYGSFIVLPAAMAALNLLIIKLIDSLLAELKSQVGNQTDDLMRKVAKDPNNITDDDIKAYVKQSSELQSILKYADSTLNEDSSSDIVMACANPNYSAGETETFINKLNTPSSSLKSQDFIDIATAESDFDEKTDGFNTELNLPGINTWQAKLKNFLPWLFIVYIILLQIKEFITQNERPSKYRGKFISKRLRLIGALLKKDPNSKSNSIKSLIAKLKSLDSAIGAVLLAVLVYEFNRKFLQESAMVSFNETVSDTLCPSESIPEASTINTALNTTLDSSASIVIVPDNLSGFSCPLPLDNYITPQEPIEDAADSFSCPIPIESFQTASLPSSAAPLSDIATKAIYKNFGSSSYLYTRVKPGQSVNEKTLLFSKGTGNKSIQVYSAVTGTVTHVDKKKQEIVIKDIKDPDSSDLESEIKKFSALLQEQTEVDQFLKKWYVKTLLPPMLSLAVKDPSADGITYLFGGIEPHYQTTLNQWELVNTNYETKAQNELSSDKVTVVAENETLPLIKNTLEKLNKQFYSQLQPIGNSAKQKSKKTLFKQGEYTLIEWYWELYDALLVFENNSQSLEYKRNTPPQDKVENKTLQSFLRGINSRLIKRVFVDSWSQNDLGHKINTLCTELDHGETLPENYKPDQYYKRMDDLYRWAIRGGKTVGNAKKAQDSISSFISSLGKNETELTSEAKNPLKYRVWRLYNFAQEVKDKRDSGYSTETDKKDQTASEARYINYFFNKLWRKHADIPKKLKESLKKLDEYGRTPIPPSIIERDGEEYRLYGIGDERTCLIPNDGTGNDRQSPFSAYEFKDMEYWLKYCAFATLASVIGFPLTWSTGLPPPIGPIPFPTVYIPIKAFQLKWGTLVIGLSLTGIYPFPFVMVANLSTDSHIPFGDPATILLASIDLIKRQVFSALTKLKTEVVQKGMDEKGKEVNEASEEIERIEGLQSEHRKNKPRKDRTKPKAEANEEYRKAKEEWEAERVSLEQEKVEAKRVKYGASQKWDVLKGVQQGGKVEDDLDVPELKTVKNSEESIETQFDRLNGLVDQIDPFVAALPISTGGGSANFFPTLKNPKPITEMDAGLNFTTNEGLLDTITKPMDLDNEDLTSTNFKGKVNNSFINKSKWNSVLAASSIALIPKEAFPKYENLKATNLAWTVAFLLPSWAPTGAGQYGFPGFAQFAI